MNEDGNWIWNMIFYNNQVMIGQSKKMNNEPSCNLGVIMEVHIYNYYIKLNITIAYIAKGVIE